MLKNLIRSSRSYRSFARHAKISRELLLDWVDCARLSPSSKNLQVLKFRIVHTTEECAAVLPLTGWAGRLKDIKLPPKEHEPAAYIIICADTEVSPAAESFQRDVGIAAQSIMLAACEAGYGGCMIGSFSKEKLIDALALPSHILPQLVLALGRPDEDVALCEPTDGDIAYYREDGVHYVPKRPLDEIIIE